MSQHHHYPPVIPAWDDGFTSRRPGQSGIRPLPEIAQAYEQAVALYRQGRSTTPIRSARASSRRGRTISTRCICSAWSSCSAARPALRSRCSSRRSSSIRARRRLCESRHGARDAQSRRGGAGELRQGAGARARQSRCAQQPRQCASEDSSVRPTRSRPSSRRSRSSPAISAPGSTAAMRSHRFGRSRRRSRNTTACWRRNRATPRRIFNRGNALSSLGRMVEAVAAFDRALALRPNYPKALINRGIALQALGRHPEALASFRAVLALDKNNADAQHNEALALLTLGDFRRGFALTKSAGSAPACRRAAAIRQAAVARRISARAQDHPAACRAGARRHHPVRALCAAARARGREGGARSASRN